MKYSEVSNFKRLVGMDIPQASFKIASSVMDGSVHQYVPIHSSACSKICFLEGQVKWQSQPLITLSHREITTIQGTKCSKYKKQKA